MEGTPVVLGLWASDAEREAVEAAVADLAERDFSRRLWARDAGLWKADAVHRAIIENALGWLTVPAELRDEVEALAEFADEVRADGVRHLVLLGMGGSSLAPETLHAVFGSHDGFPDLRVLDSTDPDAVLAVHNELDLDETLFIVASKSGGTTETASFHAYFYRLMQRHCGDHAGRHFIAITDEHTSLQDEAVAQGFRAVFINPSDIGGRYSALSFFGMVPAALMGLDLQRLLDDAAAVARACAADVPAGEDPALRLGACIGAMAAAGRDKLTLLAPGALAPFGAWIEQLVAESTGKEGTGVLPVDLEPIGEPDDYGADRLFVCLRLDDDGAETDSLDAAAQRLSAAGLPVMTISLPDRWALGGGFLLWEIATAAAGALLSIDPFDQPNVQESKDNTRRLLDLYSETGALPGVERDAAGLRLAAAAADAGLPLSVATSAGREPLRAALGALLRTVRAGDYVCLQAWLEPSAGVWAALDAARRALRGGLRVATTAGFGPRFLHSTGQYHKGGPDTGVFLQLVSRGVTDARIPDQVYPFSVLKQAQADGDLQSLRSHGRRVLRVDLGDDVAGGLEVLVHALQEAAAEIGPAGGPPADSVRTDCGPPADGPAGDGGTAPQ